MNACDEKTATVTHVIPGNDPFAVAKSPILPDQVTFSLGTQRRVWNESDYPTVGAEVVLSDIRKVKGKWRAYHARFLRPEDEKE